MGTRTRWHQRYDEGEEQEIKGMQPPPRVFDGTLRTGVVPIRPRRTRHPALTEFSYEGTSVTSGAVCHEISLCPLLFDYDLVLAELRVGGGR